MNMHFLFLLWASICIASALPRSVVHVQDDDNGNNVLVERVTVPATFSDIPQMIRTAKEVTCKLRPTSVYL